jgi:Ras family
MILANKSDVEYDAVKEAQIKTFMAKHQISLHREVSAKTGNQVGDAFRLLA